MELLVSLDHSSTVSSATLSQRNIFESLRVALRVAQDRRLSDPNDLRTVVCLEISAPTFLDDEHLRQELESEFGRVRLSWDGDLEKMFIKAMPTTPHEGSTVSFALIRHGLGPHFLMLWIWDLKVSGTLRTILPQLLTIWLHVATTLAPNKHKKEGDSVLLPKSRWVKDRRALPSLVIEAGDSESWKDLKKDAEVWLTSELSWQFVHIQSFVNKTYANENNP